MESQLLNKQTVPVVEGGVSNAPLPTGLAGSELLRKEKDRIKGVIDQREAHFAAIKAFKNSQDYLRMTPDERVDALRKFGVNLSPKETTTEGELLEQIKEANLEAFLDDTMPLPETNADLIGVVVDGKSE